MRRMTTRVDALENSDVNGCSKYTEHVRLTYKKNCGKSIHFFFFSFEHTDLKSFSQRLVVRKKIYTALLVVV